MRLTAVAATNLKVLHFAHDLSPVTLIVGDSERGKTAIIDAVKITILGYHPNLGEKNASTFRLSRDTVMESGVKLGGFPLGETAKIQRCWRAEGQSVKLITDPDSYPLDPPALLFDYAKFTGLTSAERLAHIFGLCDLDEDGCTLDLIMAKLRSLELPENTAATEAARADLMARADDLADAMETEGGSIQDWIAATITACTAEVSAAGKEVKTLDGSIQSDAKIRADATVELPEDPTGLIRKAEAELGTVRKALGQAEEKQKQLLKDQAHARELRAAIKESLLHVEHPELVKNYEDVISRPAPDIQKLSAIAGLANAAAARAAAVVDGLTERLEALALQQKELQHQKKCPYCKKAGKGWKDEFAEELDQQSFTLGEQFVVARMALQEARNNFDAASKDLTDATKAQADRENARTALNTLLRDIAREKAEADVRAAQQKELASINHPVDALEQASVALAALEADEKAIQTTLGKLRQDERVLVAARAKAAQVEQAKQKRALALAKQQLNKAAVTKLQEIQEGMIAKAVGPVMARANLFLDGVIPHKLEYRDGEFGYYEGATFVTPGTFSGTRKAVSYAALAFALAVDSPIKLVIIDELGVADPKHRVKIITRMAELVEAGEIDQFIGLDSNYDAVTEAMARIGRDQSFCKVIDLGRD